MEPRKPDFSGYATKAGIRCSDGRTITHDAFKDQHQQRVPLVWQHGHSDIKNVLGYCILEHRANDGVYAYAFLNDSEQAVHAGRLVEHGDINHFSIWANHLVEKAGSVLHGIIREVSLVLSGANPGAVIETVSIRHSADNIEDLEDEAIIHTGLVLDTEMWHADDDADDDDDDDEDGDTIQDVYDSMNEEQQQVLHFMLGQVLEDKAAAQSAIDTNTNANANDSTPSGNAVLSHTNSTANSGTITQEGKTMSRNVFEANGTGTSGGPAISHDDMMGILDDMKTGHKGTLKSLVKDYALAHGINDIDTLFPEAKTINDTPEWISRRMEWVADLLGSVRRTPFSRVRTLNADITHEDARAKGYVKGSLKKEEFFSVAARVTTPTTIYKKQALDRDDMIDITDFDVVVWLKAEMRLMLDEELARAILLGDGREVGSADKINEEHIRPVLKDHELYVTTVTVNIDDANSDMTEVSDAMMLNRFKYKGTGSPTLYTTEYWIAKFLTTRDEDRHRMWKNLDELAQELRVSRIVPVEVMLEYPNVVGIMFNPVDYVLGADKGGQVSMFDQFDIDFNKEKFLIETRVSGALVKIKSAMVILRTAGANVAVAPNVPAFDATTGALTIVDQTGVVYKHGATTLNAAGSPYTVDPGDTWVVEATPASGYYFTSSDGDEWVFTADA